MKAAVAHHFPIEGMTLAVTHSVLHIRSTRALRVLSNADTGDDLALTRNVLAVHTPDLGSLEVPSEQFLHQYAVLHEIREPYVGLVTTAPLER
jgi:hypothetical protein